MPRDGSQIRSRLQEVALKMYDERGFDEVTSAEIAAAAGVTQRTFFRHFPDKREVLFDGEAALSATLVDAIAAAPDARPWAMLFRAFSAVEPLLVTNRRFSEPRRRIIAASAALQERENAKLLLVTRKVSAALVERGATEQTAMLVAQLGMAAFGQAFSLWLDSEPPSFVDRLTQAFKDVHDYSA